MRRASSRSKPLSSPYEAAVQFLANRPRSVAEIRRHLRGKRYDDEAIDGAIDKLRAQRYVDDLDFAKYWVEQRSRFRPKGDRALVSELSSKGVARETIDARSRGSDRSKTVEAGAGFHDTEANDKSIGEEWNAMNRYLTSS